MADEERFVGAGPDGSRGEPARTGLDVGLGVAAVARRLGVAAGTLRTWDRRYGLGPSGHAAGAHRRYTAGDLSRLTLMRRLMLEGVGAAQAARAAIEADVADVAPLSAPSRRARAVRGSRIGGGRVIALRNASPAARGLARAAMALDSATCSALIGASLGRRGVVPTWDELVRPVLTGVGDRWRATGTGVEVEHLLSECVEDGLRAVTRRLRHPLNSRPVLLAALEAEEHRLPLHALAAALAERQVGVRMLGARLPAAALSEAVTRTGAAAVFVWAQVAAAPGRPSRSGPLEAVPALRPAPVLLVGGPGWQHERLPPHVRRLGDLGSAVEAVSAVVGVDSPEPR